MKNHAANKMERVSETMNWWRRLAAHRILDVGAVVLMASVLVWWALILPPRWSDYDFNHYYSTGWMLLHGQNPYTTPMASTARALGLTCSHDLPIAAYPPPFIWMFAALAVLPPRAAFAAWLTLELCCIAIILWLTRKVLGEKLSARGFLFVVALAIVSRAVSYSLYNSQAQLLLAALVLAAYAAHRAGRTGWACVAASTAGVLKIYPFLLLPWFVWSDGTARGRWRRLLGSTAFIVAAVIVTGPGLWRDALRYGIPMGVDNHIGRTFHFSLSALVTNFGFVHEKFHPSPEARRLWWLIGTGTGLLVIAIAYAVCLSSPRDLEAQFCLLCAAMLTATVTTQGHYFVFLVFPLTAAALRIAEKPTGGRIIGLVILVLAFNCVDPPESPFLNRHLILLLLASDLPLYGLLALAAFFWAELRGSRARDPIDNERLYVPEGGR
jgi:hypothetical protein